MIHTIQSRYLYVKAVGMHYANAYILCEKNVAQRCVPCEEDDDAKAGTCKGQLRTCRKQWDQLVVLK